MISYLKNRTYPIGADVGDDCLKLAQLSRNGKAVSLIAGGSENRPENIEAGSVDWQRWAIEAIQRLTASGKFRGREVIAAMPTNELFLDHIRMPKLNEKTQSSKRSLWGSDGKLEDAILSKVKQKLPFDYGDAVIKYIPTEDDNLLVIATERKKIDRHLAIYKEANLAIKSMGVWPEALINSYVSFFARRKSDLKAVVMLLDIEANCTNLVICRHRHLLFAHSIPIGLSQLGGVDSELCSVLQVAGPAKSDKRAAGSQTDEMMTRLLLEVTACRRNFRSMYRKAQIERLIFLSGRSADRDICAAIAKQLELPAQMGDCLAAVEMSAQHAGSGIDRRNCRVNWANVFGLSLQPEV